MSIDLNLGAMSLLVEMRVTDWVGHLRGVSRVSSSAGGARSGPWETTQLRSKQKLNKKTLLFLPGTHTAES